MARTAQTKTASTSSLTTYSLAAMWACLGMLLAACSSDTGSDAEPTVTPAEPQSGGTLVVGLPSEPDSMNIYLARTSASLLVANRVLPRLVEERMGAVDGSGFKPLLASNWTENVDDPAVTFDLRNGSWSDGSPISCEDVKYTLAAQTDADLAWRGASMKKHIEEVTCPDPDTAVFNFDSAYPGMLMDANDVHLLPAALSEIPFSEWRETDWSEALVSSGPFKIEQVVPGQEIVLARQSPNYLDDEMPYLDRVVLRVVPDDSARVTQLLSGELDMVTRLSPADAQQVRARGDIRIESRPAASYTYVGWNAIDPNAYKLYRQRRDRECAASGDENCRDQAEALAALAKASPHPLFGDARVRRALTIAIDRETIVDTLLLGEGSIPTSPILNSLPQHDPDLSPWPHDVANAKALLAEAGWTDADGDGVLEKGSRVFEFDLLVQAGQKLKRDSGVLIQDQLADVGVKVNVVPVEGSGFYQQLGTHDFDAWVGGWLASLRVDMTSILHTKSCGGVNFGTFADDELDALGDAAQSAMDEDAAIEAWRRWESKFHELQPYSMLYQANRLTGVSARVHGTSSILSNDDLAGVEGWWVEPR